MIFQCEKCKGIFEEKGLHLTIHGVSIGRVCPECLSGMEEIRLIIRQATPGKPYELVLVETEPREDGSHNGD